MFVLSVLSVCYIVRLLVTMNQTNALAPWSARSFAYSVLLPYPITYTNWSYAWSTTLGVQSLSSTNPPNIFTGSSPYPFPLNATMPANSIYIYGGDCGRNINTGGGWYGDSDVSVTYTAHTSKL